MSCSELIEIDLRSSELAADEKDHTLQFLPAKIKYSGEAKVQTYLTDFITKDQDASKDTYQASFRGYPLNGRIVETPAGYTAFVLEGGGGGRSSKAGLAADDDNDDQAAASVKMRAVSKVNKMTVWNYDKPGCHPHDNPVSKAFQWLQIANVVAGISDDEDEDDEKENSSADDCCDQQETTPSGGGTRKRKRSE